MSFQQWLLVLGGLLLILGLASAYVRLLPITTSALYLGFGLLIGPLGLGLWQQDLPQVRTWLGHLVEVAVLVSLFLAGLRLRLPLNARQWRPAWLLAGPVLVATVLVFALLLQALLGLDFGFCLLLAAILSPTDPVLANLIQVNHASDTDPMRFALTGEAGLNDGIAFPFVMLGLLFLQGPGLPGQATWLHWLANDVLWAVPVGLLVGFGFGRAVGRGVIRLRARHTETAVSPNDFIALAVIALSYVLAEALGGWGFLSTFAAGLGMRHAEARASGPVPAEESARQGELREDSHTQALIEFGEDPARHPQIAASALMVDIQAFGNLLERILEVLLVTVLGALLAQHWRWEAVPVALLLFVGVRPLMVALLLGRHGIPRSQRYLVGWFGIRGIGSLYYLCFALAHAPQALDQDRLGDLVLSVVALSILLHGLSIQPLLKRFHPDP
ncbi:cation:proton antiporter [Metapseudomonas otitidis]|uniref:cation:proton antiporter n=1 Tax=Metapseudomonas otitidis TaxID=319939 RepID=UPI0025412F23|nr:cation:proton antiporter [Pseudomonas otitidis]WIF70193.1 cation:proton antiporter [Pseudomonas otitidis]